MVTYYQSWLELSKKSTFLRWPPFLNIARKRKDESDKQYPPTSSRVSNQATKERTSKLRGIILPLFISGKSDLFRPRLIYL
jgi:hypothetical protein